MHPLSSTALVKHVYCVFFCHLKSPDNLSYVAEIIGAFKVLFCEQISEFSQLFLCRPYLRVILCEYLAGSSYTAFGCWVSKFL